MNVPTHFSINKLTPINILYPTIISFHFFNLTISFFIKNISEKKSNRL